MARRPKRKLEMPVRITFDGEELYAEKGEPVAAALIGAGHISIARSPKFHRPRGPACLRAACDGCLARVDGVPNVMTCIVPAEEGMVVESQNTLGPRDLDLLRMTDWFFPSGMNHHELFAGVPGVQRVMQVFARRVAGLGKLPGEALEPRAAKRHDEDVLVVGGGPSGMAIANAFHARGRKVRVVDDTLEWGGSSRGFAPDAFASITGPFAALVREGKVRFDGRTTCGAVFGDDALLVGPAGAEIANAKTLVLASGAHDGILPFEGNDAPGVLSARAGAFLAWRSIAPFARVVLCTTPESDHRFAESFVRAVKEKELACEVTVVEGVPVAARGSSRVKEVEIREGEASRVLPADALLVDAPRTAAYELAEQAGGSIVFERGAFRLVARNGTIREGVLAVGELAGTPLVARDIEAAAVSLAG